MKKFVMFLTVLFFLNTNLSAQWQSIGGQARDVGVGANGTVWVIGWTAVPGGYNIARWNGSFWEDIPGGAVRIDVDPNGNAWVVNDAGAIFRWNGQYWEVIGGQARDVGIGADGTVWVIGWTAVPGGYNIARWNGNFWEEVPGGAVRIDVDQNGRAWVVNDAGAIFRWNGQYWEVIGGQGRDISISADGTPWLIGWVGTPGGYFIYRWNGSFWEDIPGGLNNISAGRNEVWGVNDAGIIWRQNISFSTNDIRLNPGNINLYLLTVATLYPNANFQGTSASMTNVGSKTLSELGLSTVGSIKVGWGYKAIIRYGRNLSYTDPRTGRTSTVLRETREEIIGDREGSLPNNITSIEIVAYTPLNGFVDMHTHPASQLGFGKELFYGGNDGNIAQALGQCNCTHNYIQKVGFFEPDGYCGQQNFFRNKLVDKMDEKYEIPAHVKLGGYPDFANWPKNRSVLHQQMWWEWIKRAKDGGLRVVVALAVNSHILADAAETSGTYDDEQAIEDQIEAIKQLARNHSNDFEIALTPAAVRRIVSSGKLAVILGTETDNIGNFYAPANPKVARVAYNSVPTNEDVKREIDKLWNMGIRYIFPIHITDNVFGGSAIYETGFNAANKYNTGRVFNAEVVNTAETGIGFKLGSGHETFSQSSSVHDFESGFEYLLAGMYDEASNFFNTFGINTNILPNHIMPNVRGNYPAYANIGEGRGHRNALGLTATGQYAINYMMKKGMMIDIDHMSEKSATATLGMATQFNYPVNSGHNGLRGTSGNENARTLGQLTTIKNLGGLFGLGHGGEASHFLNYYREALRAMDYKQIAIGTDANGLFPLPDKPEDNARINYDSGALTRCQTGNKKWDYNEEGMAHYGLFPDFIESLTAAGMTVNEKRIFFSSAEYFAQMWEKCERQKTQIR